MSELAAALMNPGSMSQAQWMLLAIGLFIVVGALYFVLILYRLLKNVGKSDYKPNIGLSRLKKEGYRPSSVRNLETEGAEDADVGLDEQTKQ